MSEKIIIADMFCGAGGTSAGAALAVEALGKKMELYAMNHWDIAVETHSQNYPGAHHFCQDIDDIDPRKIFQTGRIKLLCASPECTHHSNARGGRPRSDQSRAGAWNIIRWASDIYIDNILVENVPEFQTWGPLGVDGLPLQSRKGAQFEAWVNALQSLGYTVDWKVLNCADYGDPTTRRRFFLQARRGRNRRITWPQPTHSETPDIFGSSPWVPAEKIIDWELPAPSIFTRKKPLSKNTVKRIIHGLERFDGNDFLALLYGTSKSKSVNKPIPTITASGQHIALCKPFIIMNSWFNKNKDIRQPLPTLTTRNNLSICQPYLIKYYGTGKGVQSIREPLGTLTTKDRFALIKPCIKGERPVAFDIGYRMLQPHELAAAMSFPQEYRFAGNKTEQVKQIGNAVPVRTAEALIKEMIA